MSTIILYYSDGGTTKIVAETLALNLRTDICRIKDMKKRDGIRNRLSSTIDAFRETKTEIYPPRIDLEEYFGKKVYLSLYVKVIKNWRDKERYFKELGFNELND